MSESVLPAAKPYCSAVESEYLATATAPLPSDTAFEDYKTRRRTSTSTGGSPAPTSAVNPGDYFPECSLDCLTSVVGATDCATDDFVCICLHSNQYKIYEASEKCVIDACGFEVAQSMFLHPCVEHQHD